MDSERIKRMLDACYQAKRIRDMLPPLPQGVTPAYIHYLDTIQALERRGICVKVSDISDALELPRPGVTRTVKEMAAKGYLRKYASEEDGRVTYISLTEAGYQLSQKYDEQFFAALAPYMDGISEEEARTMIVNGFADPVSKELPLEYAVEMNNLIKLEMEGAIG